MLPHLAPTTTTALLLFSILAPAIAQVSLESLQQQQRQIFSRFRENYCNLHCSKVSGGFLQRFRANHCRNFCHHFVTQQAQEAFAARQNNFEGQVKQPSDIKRRVPNPLPLPPPPPPRGRILPLGPGPPAPNFRRVKLLPKLPLPLPPPPRSLRVDKASLIKPSIKTEKTVKPSRSDIRRSQRRLPPPPPSRGSPLVLASRSFVKNPPPPPPTKLSNVLPGQQQGICKKPNWEPCISKKAANQKILNCCHATGVRSLCKSYLCSFDATASDLKTAYLRKKCSVKELENILLCGSNKQNLEACCQNRGVFNNGRDRCRPFCYPAGGLPKPSISNLKCLTQFQKIQDCYWSTHLLRN